MDMAPIYCNCCVNGFSDLGCSCVTGLPRPSRAQLGSRLWSQQLWIRYSFHVLPIMTVR